MRFKYLFSGLFLITFSLPAHALLEARAFAGFGLANAASTNEVLNNAGIPSILAIGLSGIDACIRIPGTKLGLGARYDWQGVKVSASGGSGNEYEVSVKRLSALVSYRFIDRLGYIGVIGTYGITHSPWAYLRQSGTVTNYDSGQSSSTSAAFEAGMTIKFFTFGAEAGFQSYMVRDFKGPSGQAGFDINFNGGYVLALVGLRL
jgi:hypothetical protein